MNYLILGNTITLVKREYDKIIGNREYESITFGDISVPEFLEMLNYNSLFSEEKILLVKNFEYLLENKKEVTTNREKFIEYLKNPNPSTTVIFLSEDKGINREKWLKEVMPLLKIIETPIFDKPYQIINALSDIFKKEGYILTKNTLEIFVERSNNNYDICIMEFEKLKKLISSKKIDENVILENTSNYNTSDLFSFKDAVINKNIKKANYILDELAGSKFDFHPLVVMLAKEYMIMLDIKILSKNRLIDDEIAKKLNIHPYRVKILKASSNKYTEDELKKHILDLINLNIKIVSKDNIGYDELRYFIITL